MHLKIPFKPGKHDFQDSTYGDSYPIDQEWTQEHVFKQASYVGGIKEKFGTRQLLKTAGQIFFKLLQ